MQVGSLVECIESDDGYRYIVGKPVPLVPPINIGEIKILTSIFEGLDFGKKMTGFGFEDTPLVIHPILKCPCGYDPKKFKEIQPPMTVNIEEIIHQNA